MKMTEIWKKATALQIKYGGMKKAELIRAIQVGEGNFACFGTAESNCDQLDCCWRQDCLPREVRGACSA